MGFRGIIGSEAQKQCPTSHALTSRGRGSSTEAGRWVTIPRDESYETELA